MNTSVRTKSSGSPVLMLIFAVVAIVAGIAMLAGSGSKPEAVPASSLSANEIKSGMILAIDDAILMDQYGYTTENGRTTSSECALAFQLKDEKWAIISLKVPNSGALNKLMTDYLNDSSQDIGDCTFTLYARVSSLGSKFSGFLDEYVKKLLGSLNEYTVLHYTLNTRGLSLEEYNESVERAAKASLGGGIVLIILGLALFALGINRQKKHREAIREEIMRRMNEASEKTE